MHLLNATIKLKTVKKKIINFSIIKNVSQLQNVFSLGNFKTNTHYYKI